METRETLAELYRDYKGDQLLASTSKEPEAKKTDKLNAVSEHIIVVVYLYYFISIKHGASKLPLLVKCTHPVLKCCPLSLDEMRRWIECFNDSVTFKNRVFIAVLYLYITRLNCDVYVYFTQEEGAKDRNKLALLGKIKSTKIDQMTFVDHFFNGKINMLHLFNNDNQE